MASRSNNAFGDYRPSSHDVIVCAYFKAGTTWTLQIATQIAFRGDADFDNIHYAVPWPDVPAPPIARRIIPLEDPSPVKLSPTGLRVIKTHLHQTHVPFMREARYLAVTRDPKDCAVSGYRFLQSMALGPLMPSVENWVQYFLSPNFSDPWAEHLASYWTVRNEPNVLFLTYEEMKTNHSGTVRKIAAFLDVNLTPAEFRAVCEKSTFASMKAAGSRFEPGRVVPWGKQSVMMRRGASGGSDELLTHEQQRRIDSHFRSELVRLGCDFPYDRVFGREIPVPAQAPA